MITLRNLTLRRGPEPLLEHADLTLQPGRCVGLVGHNGCGKSSLFQLILGELAADEGELGVPAQWRIAHMAQEVAASDRSAVDYVLDGDTRLRQVQQRLQQAESAHDHEALAYLHAELDACDGYTAQSRAEQLLHGLGFVQAQVTESVRHFSGGWRIRLNLAQALMCPSDLLLLDEPTNHLDLDATLWLEQWLETYPGTLLVISHDRDFLDNIADDIVHIEQQKTVLYRGNYSAFELQRAERLAGQQAMYAKQQERIAEIEDFVRRFRAKATKARQAQSRIKELERMERISAAHVDSPFHFVFREAEKNSSPLINLAAVDAGYGDTCILRGINLGLQPGARIGLLGPNGAGKSTLVKTLVGALQPLAGEVVRGEHLKIGYFAQHQLEALDVNASVITHLQRLSPEVPEQALRNFAGGFAFFGDKALQPVAPFSGGEKARLALALIVWQRPNVLLLDEPTNHFDLEMRQALTEALQGYNGALVVISHDRYLLRNTVDDFWLVHGGAVTPFDGTLEDYHTWLKAQAKDSGALTEASATIDAARSTTDKKVLRQQAAEKREQLAPLKKQITALERRMEQTHVRLTAINLALNAPEIYAADAKVRLQTLLAEQVQLQKSLAVDEEAWMALQTKLEE